MKSLLFSLGTFTMSGGNPLVITQQSLNINQALIYGTNIKQTEREMTLEDDKLSLSLEVPLITNVNQDWGWVVFELQTNESFNFSKINFQNILRLTTKWGYETFSYTVSSIPLNNIEIINGHIDHQEIGERAQALAQHQILRYDRTSGLAKETTGLWFGVAQGIEPGTEQYTYQIILSILSKSYNSLSKAYTEVNFGKLIDVEFIKINS